MAGQFVFAFASAQGVLAGQLASCSAAARTHGIGTARGDWAMGDGRSHLLARYRQFQG
ncbi:hypothetical protein IWW35_002782 [Coemansia sp. RSA 1878]|nr:hypothetical protein IWW35_002782 [Coemansia sp. RSA 1878]